jgi:hypothetical protein
MNDTNPAEFGSLIAWDCCPHDKSKSGNHRRTIATSKIPQRTSFDVWLASPS